MSKTIIVTIHGILVPEKDPDKWQEQFDKWLKVDHKDIVHVLFSYGFLGPINSWLVRVLDFVTDLFKLPRFTRRARVANFKKHLLKVYDKYFCDNVHIVAHSFGTWVAKEALEELELEGRSIRICSLSLVGSVLSSRIKNNRLHERIAVKTIQSCNIWSSYNDEVARFALVPFGHLGYWGLLTHDPNDRIKPKEKPYIDIPIFNWHTNHKHSRYLKGDNTIYQALIARIQHAEKAYG